MKIAAYLKELDKAKLMRVTAMQTAHDLMREVNCKLVLTNHFIERFDLRHNSPITALRNFEITMRCLKAKAPEISGKKVAVKIASHVFIFDCVTPGIVKAISFWQTALPTAEALKGRGDILFDLG